MKIERLILGLLHTNCYIIYDEKSKDAIVVDPASNVNKILEKIENLSLNVKFIILTHAHSDHICALDELYEATNAKICIGNEDGDALCNGEINLCNFFRKPSPTHLADIFLNDNDVIKVNGFEFKVITTPGHTPGSVALLSKNILISGDTLFFESVGRTDFEGGSTSDLMSSIKNKLYTLDPSTVVYPGHGEATTIAHEIQSNPFVW